MTNSGGDRGAALEPESLRFWNGYGGFSDDGREYVILVDGDGEEGLRLPPRPWINVIANEQVGFLLSETGAGYTWSGNSREQRLTPWSNDPLSDPHGEALYIRDEETGEAWSPVPGPLPGAAGYQMRHGFGYSRCLHTGEGLDQETTFFVPEDDPLKIITLRLTNPGGRRRRLSLFAYYRLAIGAAPGEPAREIVTRVYPESNAVLAFNRLAALDGKTEVFSAVVPSGGSRDVSFTADRATFIGRGGSPRRPAAVTGGGALDGKCGAGLDPCIAWRVTIDLGPMESTECHFLLGRGRDADEARSLIAKYRAPGAAGRALEGVIRFWSEKLGALRIETPSPALNLILNGWLPYQTLSCRIWARSALYQSGGAFGFRDQLQDAAAWIPLWPEVARKQILLHAAHQFVEGDVLHWWHPPASRGIRTRFVDDLLWLPYVTAAFVESTGDWGLLDLEVRFLRGRLLDPGEDEAYILPEDSGVAADLYEHCCLAIDRSLTTGSHGLPLFGTGDWNDGMNRAGREGTGESVWMGFFLYDVLRGFLPICERRGDATRAQRYRGFREQLRSALNDGGWDGEWYRRGYYDDGTPIGSRSSDECKIDALVQAWAVISGAAPEDRAALAIDSAERHLVSDADGLIRLLAPPFEKTAHDPGYIKGYPPGVRENGGQYTHAACWFVRAVAELGRNDRAVELLEMLNPIRHASTPEQAAVYQVEPYVIAADVYGVEPHVGKGGWTWYTGSAGWMYRIAVESILGMRVIGGDSISITPCIPNAWPGFRMFYRLPGEETLYEIDVDNPLRDARGVVRAEVDGNAAPVSRGVATIPLLHDGGMHRVAITLGRAPGAGA